MSLFCKGVGETNPYEAKGPVYGVVFLGSCEPALSRDLNGVQGLAGRGGPTSTSSPSWVRLLPACDVKQPCGEETRSSLIY